jgi:hypothetical protein
MDKSIIRVMKDRENPYIIINREFLENNQLSWKAKGILAYLLSRPDDWRVMMADLINRSTDGREAVYSGIRELIEAGYIVREVQRNQAGQYAKQQYTVHERPEPKEAKPEPDKAGDSGLPPHTENPKAGKVNPGNPPRHNIESLPNTEKNKGRAYARGIPQSGGGRKENQIPQKQYTQRQYDPAVLEAMYWNTTPPQLTT